MQCWTIAVGVFSILNSLIKKLGVNGSKGTINLKKQENQEKTVSAEGIKVSLLQGTSSWLNLPKNVCKKEFTCG